MFINVNRCCYAFTGFIASSFHLIVVGCISILPHFISFLCELPLLAFEVDQLPEEYEEAEDPGAEDEHQEAVETVQGDWSRLIRLHQCHYQMVFRL